MKKILATIICSALAVAGLFAQTSIKVNAPNLVETGEQFKVTFTVEGQDNPSSFEWSPGEDFQLVWGPQTGRYSSTSIVNGKVTQTSSSSYTYILLANKAGKFTLGAATAKVKGKEIRSSSATIEVLSGQSSSQQAAKNSGQSSSQTASSGAGNETAVGTTSGNSEDIFMRLECSRKNVVSGEPIVITLKLYQKSNIILGFEDAKFPTFNGCWSQEVETPTNIEFQRENVDDQIYNAALLRKWVIIPQQNGTITVDPAELVCLVQQRTNSRSRSMFDSFFDDYVTVRRRINSAECKINVSPLPAGAPASFYGGVGSFEISASLSKDSLATHDAATLTIKVRGRGNISLLEAPKVNFPPDMEVYDAKITESTDKSTGGTTGSKTYEFPFIPRSHGDFTIPPIPYTYYDVNAGKYVTLYTPELSYFVAKGEDGGSSSVPEGSTITRSGVKSLNEDIRYITVKIPKMSVAGKFFVSSPLFLSLAGTIILLSILIWASLRRIAARRADTVGTRSRKASKMAVRRLKTAKTFLGQNLYGAFYEELHKALLGYVGDRLKMPIADLSKEKISEQLVLWGVPQEVAGEFIALVDACEFARYSPSQGHDAMQGHYEDAKRVISEIESKMKSKKSSKAGALAIAIFLMFGAGFASNAATANELWQQASQAYSEGRWAEAIQSYQEIVSQGVESAALYCNIGNSYFKSSDVARAILYYERALKVDPSFEDARHNLEIASNNIQDRIDTVPEFFLKVWTRKLCYLIKSDTWAVLSIILLLCTAIFVLLFLLSPKIAAKKAGFACAIISLFLFGMTLWFALWQKNEYFNADSAIVLRPVTAVKSSPAAESTDLFILHEGTKVKVIETMDKWSNICLSDGRQGWMPSADIEVI